MNGKFLAQAWYNMHMQIIFFSDNTEGSKSIIWFLCFTEENGQQRLILSIFLASAKLQVSIT